MKLSSNNLRYFAKLEKLGRFIWNSKDNSRKEEQKCGNFYTTLTFMIEPE